MRPGVRYVVQRGGALRLRMGNQVTHLKLQALNGVANFQPMGVLPKGVTLEVLLPGWLARHREFEDTTLPPYTVRRGGSLLLRKGEQAAKIKLQELNGVANFELLSPLPSGVIMDVLPSKRCARRRGHTSQVHHRPLV